jgi:hypothetical protein
MSFNFKDNLALGNNKFLKWIDNTGVTRANIIGMDTSNNTLLNSFSNGNVIINNNPRSFTYININNTNNVFIDSALNIGFSSSVNSNAVLTLKNSNYIGIQSTSGYLGLSGSNVFDTSSSRIKLDLNKIELYSKNQFNVYTNELLRMNIDNTGLLSILPDGSNARILFSDTSTNFSNQVLITNTSNSINNSTGSLVVSGGVAINGNLNLAGSLSFNNPIVSANSSTGTIVINNGGIGINCSNDTQNVNNGGALTISGGAAIKKSVNIGGKLTISDTTVSSNSFDGSLITYGDLGINARVFQRSNSSPQYKIAPITNSNDTGLAFYSNNDYTGNSWEIGCKNNNFDISNSSSGSNFTIVTTGTTANIGINTTSPINTCDIRGTLNVSGISNFGSGIIINTDNSIFSNGFGPASDFRLLSYGGSGIIIAGSSGYVGLGTSPNAPFQLSNTILNRKIVLFDTINNDHQFYGMGINTNTLRYQVDNMSASHVFYAGINSSTSQELMRIGGNGFVGINTSNPSRELDVNGKLIIRSTANSIGYNSGGSLTVMGGGSFGGDVYIGGAINTSSDIRLKENIRSIPNCLDKIDTIETVYFNYINNPSKELNIGFIANNFIEDFPEILKRPLDGYYSLDYSRVTPILMNCIKELKKRIIALEANSTFQKS